MGSPAGRLAAVVPAALLSICLSLADPATAGASAPALGGKTQAFVDAFSVAEIAHRAQGLRLGDRLHLEGLTLAPDEAPVGLDLERFEVFAPDGRVVVHGPEGAEERPVPANAYFRGGVIGEPESLAVVTVLADGRVRGIVRRGTEAWELGHAPAPAGSSATAPRGLAARRVERPEHLATEPFDCAADQLAPPPDPVEPLATAGTPPGASGLEADPAAAFATSYTARVAVETDNELLSRFAGDQQAVTDYVGDLFAYASSVYDREIGTDLHVSHLSLWTSPDPYTHQGTCGLYEFGGYWNQNRTGIDRTLAHFVSGKSSSSGVAWVGVLCQNPFSVTIGTSCSGLASSGSYGGDYGFSGGIRGTFNPATPSPVWDIVVVSHEIGHNFNSPHTHCYGGIGGSSSPVDQCYSAQPGCYSGTPGLPGPAGAGSGTLMSYCHLLSGGLSNTALTFGTGHPYGVLPQRVPDRMRAHVEGRAAGDPVCLARVGGGGDGGPCGDLALSGRTVRTIEAWEACGTLRAGRGGFAVEAPGHVTLRAGTVVLESGFSIGSGGRLRVESQ